MQVEYEVRPPPEEVPLQGGQVQGAEKTPHLVAEQGQVEITCQFCNQQYRFDPVDVAMLFQENPTPDSDTQH